MDKKTIQNLFNALKKWNPNPQTELKFKTPFELLVAVILSAQATDKRVNIVTKDLFLIANTPEKILKLGEKKFIAIIKSIGLYRNKGKNILKTCKILIEQFNNKVPKKREDLESLPGVGRKTANVILNTAFGQPTIAVDTHIFRIGNRTRLAPGKNPLEVEKKLNKHVPVRFKKDAHHWLILLGRYVCVARKPKCSECPVNKYCQFKNKT